MTTNHVEPQDRDRTHSMSRVHFDSADISKEHDGAIAVDMHADGHEADVHVGFLQEHHIYDLHFTVPCYLGDTVSVRDVNAHVKMTRVVANKDKTRHTVHITLTAHKHGQWSETLSLLKSNEHSSPFVVRLHANVLGKDKGTPLLKHGIHCTGQLPVENTDVTTDGDHH